MLVQKTDLICQQESRILPHGGILALEQDIGRARILKRPGAMYGRVF